MNVFKVNYSDIIRTITSAMNVDANVVKNVKILKKGMTNRSYLFSCNEEKYILRIPGEGTEKLINRQQEAEVYKAIANIDLCSAPIYLNPSNGCKITKYIENVRVCDPNRDEDLRRCMQKLRELHEEKLIVKHCFDVFERIEYYETLLGRTGSQYQDYNKTKQDVFSLKDYIIKYKKEYCLCHIDAVPDNFLFCQGIDGTEKLQLTDWEYAGMQDPHIDIAMFCVYAMYEKDQIDHLIDIYFENVMMQTIDCSIETRVKIYCYIAVCGLLWSNWSEYKQICGIEFGDYGRKQYSYAKEYSKVSQQEIEKLEK